MRPDFWHERWQLNQIGFHQSAINPYLQRFWTAAATPARGRIFVPLCGKSRDMVWLREQGYEVVGIELSEIAVRDFFTENGLAPSERRLEPFTCFEAQGYQLLCGDFFELTVEHLGGIAAVYDRAALVALPPAMREHYVSHMRGLVPPSVQTLLVTFDYPQHEMNGPPFSVTEQEVAALYGDAFDIALLHEEDILAREPRFRDKGVSRLQEKVFVLTRRR